MERVQTLTWHEDVNPDKPEGHKRRAIGGAERLRRPVGEENARIAVDMASPQKDKTIVVILAGEERLHGHFEPSGSPTGSRIQDYDLMAEASGVAQDKDGNYIPREGWEEDKYHPGLVKPTADNPDAGYLLELAASPRIRALRTWLERQGEIERGV